MENMHNCDNPKDCENEKNIKNHKANCNYHMKSNPLGFFFITSGDALATYNIAKKGLEYLSNL